MFLDPNIILVNLAIAFQIQILAPKFVICWLFNTRSIQLYILCPKYQSILLKSIIRFQASVVFINLIKSLVKRLETSQFTKGRNRFILYIREDSNSSLMGSETHRKIQIYEKRVFKNWKFTSYQGEKLCIFYFCEITKKILCGFAEPLKRPNKKRFLRRTRNPAKTYGPIKDRNIFDSYLKAPKTP